MELIHKLLKSDGYFGLCSFEEGGLGYTEQQLKEVFQSLNEIEIRKMIPMSEQDNYFGLDGFIVGLFKK